MDFKAGDRVREYRLEQLLNEGGMGMVWRACHVHLERVVAVKVLFEKLAADQSFEARFMQEARAMSRLQHPNILGVVDFFVDGGNYFLVLPFIDAGSLKERLETQAGPLPVDEALSLAEAVLDALAFAHDQGIVHRDVKPANILLDRQKRPFLTDFGIALVAGEDRKTLGGSSLGTPHYMSPEQIKDPGNIDQRTDIYSLGCVLYEMLTGRPPFNEASYTAALVAHCNNTPQALNEANPLLPATLSALVMRSLEKDPRFRYQGCREFADALAVWRSNRDLPEAEAIAASGHPVPEPGPAAGGAKQTLLSFQRKPAGGGEGAGPGAEPSAGRRPDAPPAFRPTVQQNVLLRSIPGGERGPAKAPPVVIQENLPANFDQMDRDESLEICVKLISNAKDLPAFAQSITDLLSLASNQDSYLDQLTNHILKNVSLTTKLLRVVNSVYFNRTGRKILSISHAVIMLGWNAVRNLAAGVLLFDKFNRNYPGLKELMLLSLLSANHARIIAHHTGYPDREEAYLCGMFGGLGEMMVAHYFPKSYAQILQGIRAGTWHPRLACRQVMHFNYEDLGKALIAQWGLSEKLTNGMDIPEKVEARVRDTEDMLKIISVFSRSLSLSVYSLDPQEGRRQLKGLMSRFSEVLKLKDEDIKEILNAAVEESKDTLAAASIPLDNLRMSQHIDNTLDRFSMEETQTGGGAQAMVTPVQPPARNEEELFNLAAEVETVLSSDEKFALNDLLTMVMEAIYRGGGFDRILFSLKSADHTQIQGRLGLGEGVDDLSAKFHLPISLLSGPVGPVMMHRREVFVPEVAESRFARSNFAGIVNARSFGMCPVVVNEVAIGCLYFDRLSAPLGLSPEAQETIVSLSRRLGQAIQRLRSG